MPASVRCRLVMERIDFQRQKNARMFIDEFEAESVSTAPPYLGRCQTGSDECRPTFLGQPTASYCFFAERHFVEMQSYMDWELAK